MLSVFQFDSQSVRILVIDGNPWFVAKDVALALGYKDTRSAVIDHCDTEDKGKWSDLKGGRNTSLDIHPDTVLINESGVYALIFSSKLQSAKAFKRMVTSEIMPSIRKTGKYESEQAPQFDIPKTYADALMLAANQAKTIEQLEAQKAQDAPLVAFAEKVAVAVNQISIADMAKILGTGQNKLFSQLRELKVIQHGKVTPYQKYVDKGWFVVTEFTKQCGTGVRAFPTTRVTGKGQIKIAELLGKQANGDGIVRIGKAS